MVSVRFPVFFVLLGVYVRLPGLPHDVQKEVLTPTSDRADHVTLPCGLMRVIYCLCSSSWQSHPFRGGCSLMSSMHSSLLVWERCIGALVLSAWPSSSFFPSFSLPLHTGEVLDPPPLLGWKVRLWASLCITPPRGGMTEALWLGMSVVGL